MTTHIKSGARRSLPPATLVWAALLYSTLSGLSCNAQEAPKKPLSAEQPAVQQVEVAASRLPQIAASNIQDLRGRVGQEISVHGEVSRVGSSASGHRFINFTGNPELSVFISSGDVASFKAGLPEKQFADKTIAIEGKLERFNGKLQIQVRSPHAIRVIEKAGKAEGLPRIVPQPGQLTPVELKSVGKDKWISPAGLIYEGRDPNGDTRKDHVLRHANDIPNRDGPHGVFDGGSELTFAQIDAAWEKIQKQNIKPDTENGRDTYTVHMGQRIGYLGGDTGKRKGNPPLQQIFLVVRQGTSKVITAFPR